MGHKDLTLQQNSFSAVKNWGVEVGKITKKQKQENKLGP